MKKPRLTLHGLFVLLLCLLVSNTAPAQTRQISGTVVDEKNQPVVGASVIVKGTTRGTTSDATGRFALEAPVKAVLQASFVGYEPTETTVGDRISDMRITLKEDNKMLDDVVVIGYGSIKAKELTSAVSHVSSKEFASIGTNNAMMQIQGKVAGVNISNTAMSDPNGSVSVQIRGVSSRNAGLGPLFVVDGIPGVDMTNINSNDIESIDVLKDGAASAIYGTRGGNGVIIVTTKKGARDGQTNVTYNGYVSFDKINNRPPLLTADEFRAYRVPDGATDFGSDTDWFKEVTQTGLTHSHAVTISGGTDKFNYYATIDARNAAGVDIRSQRAEYGARIALNQGAPNDILRFSLNIAPRIVNCDLADQGALDIAMRSNPTYPLMDPGDPFYYSDFAAGLPTGPNPVETLKLIENGTESKLLDMSGSVTLNILSLIDPGLNNKATFNTQLTVSQTLVDNFDYAFAPSITTTNRRAGITGTAGRAYSKLVNQNLEWVGNGRYSHKGHTVSALVGFSYNHIVSSGMSARNRNFFSDGLSYNNLGGGDNEALKFPSQVGMGSSKESSKLAGFFGRATYDYLQKYMVTASLRYEGSSRFGMNHRWGLFPAVSAGWRISDENFMKNARWIDDLKIRGDYGQTGNQNIANYQSQAVYVSSGMTYYNGQYIPVVGPNSNQNPDLHWEKGINWNIGLDFSLFDRLLTGSVNYYNRKQRDLVGSYSCPVPPNYMPTIFANVGTMKNTGFEVELHINPVRHKNFNYDIDLVMSTNDNKFVSFSNDLYKGRGYDDLATIGLGDFGLATPVQRLEEGRRVGSFYMWSYAGLNEQGEWLVWNKDFSKAIPINQSTDADKHYVGNGLPKLNVSMTHSFRFKNWDLTASFRGAFLFDVFQTNEYAFGLRKAQIGYNVYRSAYSRHAQITDNLGKPTDFWLEKGDYFKLDVLTLGYTYNLKKTRFLQSVRAYMTGRNLFTWKGYKGLDPDVIPTNGLMPGVVTSTAFYPSTTQILVGVQIKFL